MALRSMEWASLYVKLGNKQPPKKEPPLVDQDNHTRIMKLEAQQWNTLMHVTPGGSSLFKETMEPYKDNPNVIVKPIYEETSIKFEGKFKAVESAYNFLNKHLNKEIHFDR